MSWSGPRQRIVLVGLMSLLAVGSCQRHDGLPIEQLLLTQEDLPGEWIVSPEGPHLPLGDAPLGGGFGAVEASIVFFYHLADDGSAGAHEQILFFRSEVEATEAYERLLAIAFRGGPSWEWVAPKFESIDPPHASESVLRCSEGRRETMCRLVARYGRYLIDLKLDLDALTSDLKAVRVVSFENFPEIIRSVDEKMAPAISRNN